MNKATPRQIAFLEYHGVSNAAELSIDEASKLITKNEWIKNIKGEWKKDRLILHPDVYAKELDEYLNVELVDSLRSYVRNKFVGCSEKLTKPKIIKAIGELSKSNAQWWQDVSYKEIFLTKLKELYPKCCDGQPPEKKQIEPITNFVDTGYTPHDQLKTIKPQATGCLLIAITLAASIFVCVALATWLLPPILGGY
jgi:hypothetical protein